MAVKGAGTEIRSIIRGKLNMKILKIFLAQEFQKVACWKNAFATSWHRTTRRGSGGTIHDGKGQSMTLL